MRKNKDFDLAKKTDQIPDKLLFLFKFAKQMSNHIAWPPKWLQTSMGKTMLPQEGDKSTAIFTKFSYCSDLNHDILILIFCPVS